MEPESRPAPQPPEAKTDGPKQKSERNAIDPFGEEAAKLYVYLKDLAHSLPEDKQAAMDRSGVSAKLDAIIERVARPPAEPPIPTEILGMPVSSRLAKLIQFMRREKHNVGK